MVEISQEIGEAKGENPPKEDMDEASDSEDAGDGWRQLMGKDIQLKDVSDRSDDAAKGIECQPHDAVIINFVGRLANDREVEEGPVFHEGNDYLIVVGDKYVNPALEMGVRFMYEGQKIVLWSTSKFAYGQSTRKNGDYELPPGSNVRYEIFLKTVISPEKESADPDGFQLQLGLSKKMIANDMFKNELYAASNHGSQQRALRLYEKSADEMVHLIQSHQKQKEEQGDAYDGTEGKKKTDQAAEIMIDCLNNVAAVQLKAKKYHEAKDAAVKVLTHDPNNLKALLRAARAAMMDPSGTYEESDAAIAAAENVLEGKGSDDKDVRKLRQELKQKKQEYKKRRKEMMARMTKELKPKDKKGASPTSTSTSTTGEKEDPAISSSGEKAKSLEEDLLVVPEFPLWRQMLPYVFQIVFPFVLYFVVVGTSKDPNQAPVAEQQILDNEF